MAGDMIAADRPEQPRAEPRQRTAARFAGNQRVAMGGDPSDQVGELFLREVMQEKIGGDDVVALPPVEEIEDIRGHVLGAPAEPGEARKGGVGDDVLAFDEREAHARPALRHPPRDAEHEGSVARSDVGHRAWRLSAQTAEEPGHDRGLQHQGVAALDILSRADGVAIAGRQDVEELRADLPRRNHFVGLFRNGAAKPSFIERDPG